MPTRSLDDVVGWIDAAIAHLAPEELAASDALNRVLAEDAVAAVEFPPYDRAEIDGVALQAAETAGASAYNPLGFRVSGKPEAVAAGTAAQVSGGDRMPAGADAVVPLEFAQPAAPGTVDVIEAVPPEHEVGRKASHFTRGAVLVRAGRRLRASDLGLFTIGGIEKVAVVQRPRVAVVVTERGPEPLDGRPDINVAMLRALVERDGGRIVSAGRCERQPAAIRHAIAVASADAVFVIGGPERGRDREAAAAFAEAGTLEIAEIALSPGGSVAMGRANSRAWVFSLPGTPWSSFWAYEVTIGRAIRRLAGRNAALPFRQRGLKLARKIVSMIGVAETHGVRFRDDGSVEPMSGYARSDLRAASDAVGFVVVAEGSEGMPAGSIVPVHLFDEGAIESTVPRGIAP